MSICKDSRDCFAKKEYRLDTTRGFECTVLDGELYENGMCPFCKPEREVTKNKRYPYDPYMKKKEVKME